MRLILKKNVIPTKTRYILEFEYAARQGVQLSSSQFAVYWNRKRQIIRPKDYKRHQFRLVVVGRGGNN